jgi:hypothetical protein
MEPESATCERLRVALERLFNLYLVEKPPRQFDDREPKSLIGRPSPMACNFSEHRALEPHLKKG